MSPAKLGQSSLTKSRTPISRNPAPTSRVLAFHMRNPVQEFVSHRLNRGSRRSFIPEAQPTCPIPSSIQKPSWLPQLQEPGPLRRGIVTPPMLQGPGPQELTPNAPRAEWEGSEHEGIPGPGARRHPRRRELAWTT
ncbi:hypothetical protein mRhiFer1_008479 [Rhinolophus ferrumequinum]|uniref:Uncharacterized protein n=1 Tax=Rhinolophus ferrumequinum TaxID=59479 RepID=A0A7J7UWW8_RHIFE|nr:hypothetical protein mRhiFer1_008479 [Rhinolophus ferrumequinum]